jgi:hypothetical protein
VKENVIAKLGTAERFTRDEIKRQVIRFVGHDNPEIWAYYADYDWVALCWLMGTMMDLPEGWPMYCRDLKQWAVDKGDPKLPEQTEGEHNALDDAKWNREVYYFLSNTDLSHENFKSNTKVNNLNHYERNPHT